MIKYWPWIVSILAILILNAAMLFLDRFEEKIRAEENNQPKRVEITSIGVVHSWPVDNKYVKITKGDK